MKPTPAQLRILRYVRAAGQTEIRHIPHARRDVIDRCVLRGWLNMGRLFDGGPRSKVWLTAEGYDAVDSEDAP